MANETTKPEAMVSDETLSVLSQPLRIAKGYKHYGNRELCAMELSEYRSRWDSALAAAKRDGIREGLGLAATYIETSGVPRAQLASAIRTKAAGEDNESV